MACGCNKGVGRGGSSDTLGYYVVLPGGMMVPAGINPDDPEAGEPPFMLYAEAHNEVVQAGGGTVRRLKKKPTAA